MDLHESVEVLKLTERLAAGIEQGESQFREFKSALDRSADPVKGRDVKTICRDIGETLVAFANADGGELFLGVEDEGTVTGIPHKDDLIRAMAAATKTHVHSDTPLPSPTVSKFKYDGATILYFQIAKSTTRVHLTCEGRCLQRFDKENRPVPAEEIQYSRQERIVYVIAYQFWSLNDLANRLFSAAIFAALGGFLSVLIGSRQLELDLKESFGATMVYGTFRIIIGVISGVVVVFLIRADFLLGPLKKAENYDAFAVACFVAGFSERLIPNVLKNFESSTRVRK